ACLLAGADAPAQAARRLAEVVPSVVVTRGPGGVVAVVDGRELEVPPVEVGPIVDTTGAGDLFCAAYAWGELHGAGPESRLRWAALAAALSVTEPTGAAGAVTEPDLLEEGARRGLSAPPAGARAGS
ncbi:MAG: PfkB family carbohydrate kinase, partial [Pseudonocardiaceae bacterium]